MRTLDISADRLVASLVDRDGATILDSCGVGHLGSHLLIAGVDPVERIALCGPRSVETLRSLQQHLERGFAAIFTISYDFGLKLQDLRSRHVTDDEQDIYLALFDSLLVHDYDNQQTYLCGTNYDKEIEWLFADPGQLNIDHFIDSNGELDFNFSKGEYLRSIESIQEHIRSGDTYQTNLTQRLTLPLQMMDSAGDVFLRLRKKHPAPFAAYIDRGDSQVISASPERFFRIEGRTITASPIKGTRRRGRNQDDDARLRSELLSSAKDRSENTMIVDLIRNDLGRVCEYGTISVKNLCDLEEHPTLFHLVSTVEGTLRSDSSFSDVITALFPCGSITGAPKIRTMQIIDELEPSPRGLSMGAIGYFIPKSGFDRLVPGFDLSVAIRTMVVRDRIATFNVGGGITIDSVPLAELEESLLKAKALLAALGNK